MILHDQPLQVVDPQSFLLLVLGLWDQRSRVKHGGTGRWRLQSHPVSPGRRAAVLESSGPTPGSRVDPSESPPAAGYNTED